MADLKPWKLSLIHLSMDTDNACIYYYSTDVYRCVHSNHNNIKDASMGTYYERTPSIMPKVDIATKIDRDICCAEDATSSKSTVAIESAAKQDYR